MSDHTTDTPDAGPGPHPDRPGEQAHADEQALDRVRTRLSWGIDELTPAEQERLALQKEELAWRQEAHARERDGHLTDLDRELRVRCVQAAVELAYDPDAHYPTRERETHRFAESFYRWCTTGRWT